MDFSNFSSLFPRICPSGKRSAEDVPFGCNVPQANANRKMGRFKKDGSTFRINRLRSLISNNRANTASVNLPHPPERRL
jgi:hypothetical protein